MMPSQRARGAESRVRNKLSNGPLRVQSKAREEPVPSILQRVGIRQLPGICWYPAKQTNQGGTADHIFALDRRLLSVKGFCFRRIYYETEQCGF